ncbi:gliding motility-associated C-terminal domain-containing protein [Flavobacterium sp. MC2016-06]|uniref:gliding motility-associated C-terminal domain-containing protein n=1 Tax=Flavobacterium sp. MC2016-06 TaxID=2676308 RepID=UPI0012BAD5AD|nr:gliding motility-associated C-terminal domain-containing protein [Flavobacterium sp. MC2016-06]MBU3859248.1 gliding motility-associated C-terminal domain-containing protein [Flavobacterium sp. MC2016-06]
MVKKYNNFLQIILFFVFFSSLSSNIYAQCAGNDNPVSFDVCDVPAASSKTIDLFALLGGSPMTGGVWTDDFSSGGLNTTTGILNVQLIRASGTYNYTYTVSGVAGCTDNSSTVSVTVGGYSGVTSPNVSVCSSVGNFSLFQAFNGVFLSPQSNGTWHDDINNVNVNSTINVGSMEGTYQYTYTMPAIGSCPAMSSTAVVTVFKAPKSGLTQGLELCASDGLSAYTNFDLFSLVTGADSGGTWVDSSGTGELTFVGDHFINLQNIYNSYGAGTYSFTYQVPSESPICPLASSGVAIRLQDKLDFTGAILEVNSDICESEIATADYTGTITRGPAVIPDGFYRIVFDVSGPRAARVTVEGAFNNGVLSFPISSQYFQRVGSFKVSIVSIVLIQGTLACQNIINNLSDDLNIYPIPNLEGAVITQATTCQNEDALVTISNATKLADGVYDIVYSIRGANIAAAQIARVTAVGGVISDFVVPGSLNANSGTSVITITAITHVISQCVSGALLQGEILINPLPNASSLRLQATSVCFGQAVTVAVSGLGTMTDVTLSYLLSDSNTATVQTVVLAVTNGNASFVLPAGLLVNSGSTTIIATNLKNNTTTCGIAVNGIATSFVLNPIPAAPIVVSPQSFCKVDNATIANLQPNGTQYKWYASATATTPLASTYALQSEDYYVKVTSSTGCTSEASVVSVIINDTPAPVLNSDGQNFCGTDNPTILSLSNNTNSPSTVVWYDAPNNGNLLAASTALIDKATYYGFDSTASTGCISFENLSVTVSLTDCDSPQYPFFIPDGFSPNGDGVNDVFVIPNIDFLYPDYTIEIFNRYGNGMYKGGKDKPGWDGINYETKGISSGVAPNGVYFYIINFNKDNKPPKQGRLYLNR